MILKLYKSAGDGSPSLACVVHWTDVMAVVPENGKIKVIWNTSISNFKPSRSEMFVKAEFVPETSGFLLGCWGKSADDTV